MHEDARNARGAAQETGCAISNGRESHRNEMRRARMSIFLPSILLILIAATSVSGQRAPPTIDVTKLGPQAGERVADFRLQDQDGKGMDAGYADGGRMA
jgi:hypothetical protein